MPEPTSEELPPVKMGRDRPYRNEVRCIGVTSWKGWDPAGCSSNNRGRYSVGPIPTEPDMRKSPRCPNCGGLVIEIARFDRRGTEYSITDSTFADVLDREAETLEELRKAHPISATFWPSLGPSQTEPDMRLIVGAMAVPCAGCGAHTGTHLLLGHVDSEGTRIGDSRPMCVQCRIKLAATLLQDLT